ncbi:MAG: hypothetical protein LBE36_14355 [Flavobacteriaceae bacterium]|jgi:hypothetical protein|nr:hypothetical protein [Flavobacteriaceae bacterium]
MKNNLSNRSLEKSISKAKEEYENRLKTLSELKNSGVLSDEEVESKRKEIQQEHDSKITELQSIIKNNTDKQILREKIIKLEQAHKQGIISEQELRIKTSDIKDKLSDYEYDVELPRKESKKNIVQKIVTVLAYILFWICLLDNMIASFVYLLIAYIIIKNYYPKTKAALWRYTIWTPLIVGFWHFPQALASHYFSFGLALRDYLSPAIMCGLVLYFYLRKKMNNNGIVEFPIWYFVVMIIVLGIGLFEKYLENKIEEDMASIRAERYEEVGNRAEEHYATEEDMALQSLKTEVAVFNQKLPKDIGRGIILYNVEFNEKAETVDFFCRSEDVSIYDFTEEDVSRFKKEWREQIIETSLKSENDKQFIKADVPVHWILEDKDGKFILQFMVYPSEMGGY